MRVVVPLSYNAKIFIFNVPKTCLYNDLSRIRKKKDRRSEH
jgi:hypothetical protein